VRGRDPAANWSEWVAGGPVKLPFTDDEPPGAPGTPVVSNLTPTGFTVTWPAATDDNGITRYEVWLDPPTGDDVLAGSTDGATTTLAVTGLTPDTRYGVRVRAFDRDDRNGPFSETVAVTTPPAGSACTATYRVMSQWGGGGFHAEVTIRNTGTAMMNAWTVRWTYGPGQRIQYLWAAKLRSGDSPSVVVGNEVWNGAVPPGRTTTFGLIGTGGASPLPAPVGARPSPTAGGGDGGPPPRRSTPARVSRRARTGR
jgi:hypothetical protein